MAEAGVPEKLKVFISYSRRDSSEFADELVAGLEYGGFAPFLDRHDIAAGEDWEARLGGLIAQSDTVVFVVSPESVKSERCVWEVTQTGDLSKRLIPVIYKPVPDSDIPQQLSRLQFVRFDGGRGLARPLAELAEALRLDLDWIREHTRLGELAARWQARGRPESLLLRGDDLDAAKAWAAQRKAGAPAITEGQRTFLHASEEAEGVRLGKERAQLEEMRLAQVATARHQKRAGRLLWAVAMLVLAVFGYVTWQAYDVSRREVAVFKGHTARIETAAFDLEGRRVVSAGFDTKARVWDAETGAVLATASHPGWVRSAEFAPDGRRVVTAIDRDTAFVWEAATVKLIVALEGHTSGVHDAQFDRQGKRVLTASWDGTARIWNAESGQELVRMAGANALVSARFDPEENRVVTASFDGTARIWDVASGKEIAVLRGHTATVSSATFSPDGRRVLTASSDKTARIWDVTWAARIRGDELRERVCAEKLLGPAQEFTEAELEDPILRGIDRNDPVARNPCLRRGPLTLDYWSRLIGNGWHSLRRLAIAS